MCLHIILTEILAVIHHLFIHLELLLHMVEVVVVQPVILLLILLLDLVVVRDLTEILHHQDRHSAEMLHRKVVFQDQ